MKPSYHVVISFGLAAFIYAWFSSLWAGLVCFFAGVFLDIDHIPEYLTLSTRKKSLKDFYHSKLANEKERVYLVLHSYELIFLLWLAIQIFNLNLYWVAIAVSISIHLIFDQIHNPLTCSYTYFFTYRAMKGFNSRELFFLEREYGLEKSVNLP